MTLDKAIEILNLHYRKRKIPYDEDYYNALNLGIGAVKFRQRWEQQEGEPEFPLLPGETKE